MIAVKNIEGQNLITTDGSLELKIKTYLLPVGQQINRYTFEIELNKNVTDIKDVEITQFVNNLRKNNKSVLLVEETPYRCSIC